jgi:anti-sigma B factor antagonist
MEHLTIKDDERAGWTVLTVSGELDVYTASVLRTAVAHQLAVGRTSLVVDVAAVPFIDSSGLGVLIGGQRHVRALDGRLRIVTDRPSTLKLLRISGLFAVLDVHASVADALAA